MAPKKLKPEPKVVPRPNTPSPPPRPKTKSPPPRQSKTSSPPQPRKSTDGPETKNFPGGGAGPSGFKWNFPQKPKVLAKIQPEDTPSSSGQQVFDDDIHRTLSKEDQPMMRYMDFLDGINPRNSEPGYYEKLIFGDITKLSALKQMVIGGIIGLLTRYFVNIGLYTVSTAIIAVVAAFQIAVYNDWISVNVTKVRKSMTRARHWAQEQYARQNRKTFACRTFLKDNFFITLGVVLGYLVGVFVPFL